MSSLPKYKKDQIKKTTKKRWRHCFPHCKSMGVSVAMETRVLIQSAPKPYAAILVMLHIKFDQDRPTGFRDIQV